MNMPKRSRWRDTVCGSERSILVVLHPRPGGRAAEAPEQPAFAAHHTETRPQEADRNGSPAFADMRPIRRMILGRLVVAGERPVNSRLCGGSGSLVAADPIGRAACGPRIRCGTGRASATPGSPG